MELPKRYDSDKEEEKWLKYWEKEEIFKFDPESKKEIYSVDSPPPTVSGNMHIGHSFSFSQQDFIMRYHRMSGKNIFCPFGTDDNGLATERMIEKMKKVRGQSMDRKEFAELCLKTLEEIRPDFVYDWKRIGISADYSIYYSTINEHSQKISQKSFLDLYKENRIYRKYAPVIFCPQCRTAIAQVEMEDKESKSTLNYIKAKFGDSYLIYATTRPEVLYGCVGMSINKNGTYVKIDKDGEILITSKESLALLEKQFNFTIVSELKGKELIGEEAIIPISEKKVIVSHDEETKAEFGTGIVYYCTYGGSDCVEWMGRHPEVEAINVMGLDGKYNENSGRYKGMNSQEARKQVLEDLEKERHLLFKEPINHVINVHERCGTDIEYIATDQWFIKYLDLKKNFLAQGKKINWFPTHMKNRYDNWIKGLKWDWNISRQRHFGVPIPAWHCKKCEEIVIADEKQLPVDPLTDKPKNKCKCGSSDFIPEKDVLDTWATSSLTPQLAIELFKDKPIYKKLFPMNLRPQAHDIITFWLFNTVVKSYFHKDSIPWKNIMISGWALDPHGKKMSKSKGNVVDPREMIKKYSADALRFWAAGSRLGDDLPFQEKDLVTGVKFTNKIWNASKFAFMHLKDYKLDKPKKLELMDKWILVKLSKLIKFSTENFERYEYSHTKLETDKFFWQTFCDNYLEIVKDRLYNPDKRGEEPRLSAQYTLYQILLAVLKLMAPITPFITEELYHHFFKQHEKDKSIHISKWPGLDMKDENAEKAGDLFVFALQEVRKAKSASNLSLKSPIKRLLVKGKINVHEFNKTKEDLISSTSAEEIEFEQIPDNQEMDYEAVVDL